MEKYTIIGVVRDYHFQSLHEPIRPLILYNANPFGGNFNRLSIRTKPENIHETLTFIKAKWKEFEVETEKIKKGEKQFLTWDDV